MCWTFKRCVPCVVEDTHPSLSSWQYSRNNLGLGQMESVAYILVLAGALGTLFFAIAFRDPPKIQDDE